MRISFAWSAALVLVNGVPGAGQDDARDGHSRARLPATLVSKDAIKEALGIRGPPAPRRRRWGRRGDWKPPGTLTAANRRHDRGSIPWWFKPRDLRLCRGPASAEAGHPTVIEVWCDVPVRIAHARYEGAATKAGERAAEIHGSASDRSGDALDAWDRLGGPAGEAARHRADVARPTPNARSTFERVARQVLDALRRLRRLRTRSESSPSYRSWG